MTFMAKGLMMILLLLAVSACGLAQSCIPLEIQPFDYTLDVHGTRYVGTAVVSPVPGEPSAGADVGPPLRPSCSGAAPRGRDPGSSPPVGGAPSCPIGFLPE